MSRPQITLRYEIMTVERTVEETLEAPDDWDSMSDGDRHQWCLDALGDGISNYLGTSYEWEGMD